MLNHTFFDDKVVKREEELKSLKAELAALDRKYSLNLRRRLRKKAEKKTKMQQIT